MNRIAGILSLDGAPVHAGQIDRMLYAMSDPASGQQSVRAAGGAGLGCTYCRALADARSGPHLPCLSNRGALVACDGRIDNRQDLLAILSLPRNDGAARMCDAGVILAAYEKWGLDCAAHLVGDFAFVIWDPQEGRLVGARDHIGVRPFYYSLVRQCFLFGSTPLAILASGKVPPTLCEERIADHLVNPLEGVDKTSSFYREVSRLPPAHRLIVDADGMRLERYWEVSAALTEAPREEGQYIDAFREIFAEAVRCRLQDDPVPASMLSGGLDSAAIVGMGGRILASEGRPLPTVSVISSSPGANRETSYIASVLRHGNFRPHRISETELSGWMDRLVSSIEGEAEPFDHLMNLNRAVYLCAHEQGITAVLDGADGDTLLSGSGHLVQLWRSGALRTILGETFLAGGLTAAYRMQKRILVNSLLSAFTPFAPGWFRQLRQPRREKRALENSIRDSLIDPEFAVRSRLGERFARLDAHSPRPRSFRQVDVHRIVLEHPFLTVGLERYERVASAFGIEARHPLTDVRLVEFCLGLPWQLKTCRGWTKMILRRAMEPYLPADVVWRRDKDSLGWEVNRLVLRERGEYFYEITLDERAGLEPYLDVPKLMRFWDEYLMFDEEKNAGLIWTGIALALWLRRQRDLLAALRQRPD